MEESSRKVTYYLNSFRKNKERNKSDEGREETSWKFFSGVEKGQWNQSALQLLAQEGRPSAQFNLIQGKVLSVLGHFLQNPLDAKYEAEVGAPEWGPQVMNFLLMADKDRGSWDDQEKQFILSMLIHRGVIEIYKDFTVNPLGNINIRFVNPDAISFDFRWRTSNIDDCPRIWVYKWMDARQIKSTYKKKSRDIEEAANRLKQLIEDPADQTEQIDKLCDRSPDVYDAVGSQYLVVQCLELTEEPVVKLFNIETAEFLPYMSEQVARAIYSIPANKGKYELIPDTNKVLKVTTICPGLSNELLLEDGPHPLQIGGYPYIVASALNLNGEHQGIVEVMKDPQEVINKREATLTHHQMTRANGVEFIEADAFEDDSERNKYVKNGARPGGKFIVAPGSNKEDKIKVKDQSNAPTDLVDSINRAKEHMDRMWAPPSLQANQARSGESGKLFQEKREQALVALEYINRTIWNYKRQLLEKYFCAAKILYSKIPRKFNVSGTGELLINWPQPDGTIANDISQIPRLSTKIVQSQNALSIRRERLDIYSQFGQYATTPIVKATLELMMIDTIPELPESQRAMLKDGQIEFISLLRERMAAERLQLQTGMQAQMQQSQQPMAGPSEPGSTPAEGGGFSVEGKGIKPQGGVPVDVRAQNQLQ